MHIEDILKSKKFEKLDLFLNQEMEKYCNKKLKEKFIEVGGSKKEAVNMFYSPAFFLDGKRPYDLCKEGKTKEVYNFLGLIESGCLS